MRLLTTLWIAVLLPALTSAALAQSESSPMPEVTITAPRPPTAAELAGNSVSSFIESHAQPAIVTGLLTRWRSGICPKAVGLSPAFNAFVAARVRAVAGAVGAPVQTADRCKGNVSIYFTTEPQKLLDDVVKHADQLLGFHYPHQTKKLATFDHPIQVWYVTGTRGTSGPDIVDSIWGEPAPSRPAGRLGTGGLSGLIEFALVVVDSKQVAGAEVGAISDYIAMLALTRTRSLDDCGPLPSIVDLMSAACGARPKPAAITAGDLAYLKALYSLNMEQPLDLQRADIQIKMRREFEHP